MPNGFTHPAKHWLTHLKDIYSQVKAQYPEFQLPTANLTKAKELEEMAALERQPASGIEGRTNDFSGDGVSFL